MRRASVLGGPERSRSREQSPACSLPARKEQRTAVLGARGRGAQVQEEPPGVLRGSALGSDLGLPRPLPRSPANCQCLDVQ